MCLSSAKEVKGATEQAKSADYKVIKAQIQEQNFVKKLLNDRKSAVASLVKLDKKLPPVLILQKEEELKVKFKLFNKGMTIRIRNVMKE